MPDPSDKLRTILKGFPETTIRACAAYQVSGDTAALDHAVLGVVEHHAGRPLPQPLAAMPGSTTLVADLGLDSVTMIEMAFILEDIFSTSLPQEELVKVRTLDDLRAMLKRHLVTTG